MFFHAPIKIHRLPKRNVFTKNSLSLKLIIRNLSDQRRLMTRRQTNNTIAHPETNNYSNIDNTITMPPAPKRALVIVDVQNDFCEGGSLEVPKANEIIPIINKLRHKKWDLVVHTQDWHPSNHISFAANHPGKKPLDTIPVRYGLQVLWPVHCVMNTKGAEFHKELKVSVNDVIVKKGMDTYVDSYSGFFDMDHQKKTELDDILSANQITQLYVCDYCVFYTCKDGAALGYKVHLIEDASRGVHQTSVDSAIKQLHEMQVACINSDAIH